MKQEIIRSEYEPGKKFLWLHTKDGNLALEAFGDQGWESIGDDYKQAVTEEPQPIELSLPKLSEKSTKSELLSYIEALTQALIDKNIIIVKQ